MNKNHLLLIVGAALLFNLNSLTNQFIVDDTALFKKDNIFYQSLTHIPKVFSEEFLSRKTKLDSGETSFTGFVGFRPVTALSFFADYFIWKDNPFGHRLTNLLLHTSMCLLVYFLSLSLGLRPLAALLATLLFSIHPIHAELINNVGYRSDLLAANGFVLSLWTYRLFRQKGVKRYLILSLTGFILAVFSKEPAFSLPLFIIALDQLFPCQEQKPLKRKKVIFLYSAYFAVCAFYLYVYFIVFPNPDNNPVLSTGDPADNAVLIVSTLAHYIKTLFLPHTTSFIPPLYEFPTTSLNVVELNIVIIFLVVLCVLLKKCSIKKELVVFAFLWWIVLYLPTSNILQLICPMGYRFMYLPSVGFFWLAGTLLAKLYDTLSSNSNTRSISHVPVVILILFCGIMTTIMNLGYRDNYTNARAMIKYYPDSSTPYLLLGHYYFDLEDYYLAAIHYSLCIEKSSLERRPHHQQQFIAHYQLGQSKSKLQMTQDLTPEEIDQVR